MLYSRTKHLHLPFSPIDPRKLYAARGPATPRADIFGGVVRVQRASSPPSWPCSSSSLGGITPSALKAALRATLPTSGGRGFFAFAAAVCVLLVAEGTTPLAPCARSAALCRVPRPWSVLCCLLAPPPPCSSAAAVNALVASFRVCVGRFAVACNSNFDI